MKNTYVNILIESLEKKSEVLDEVMARDAEQEMILSAPDPDLDELHDNQEEIGKLAAELTRLDEGFESLYEKVRSDLLNNKAEYSEEIRVMQDLISEITEKAVKIGAEEARHKDRVTNLLREKRKQLGARRKNINKISTYANQMNGSTSKQNTEPFFVDNKK
ncbi:hypothetical protein SAMN06296386_102240 [Lachnospiraceae bacterium]|nr:hypothetical protein SAMN06296386_102240 [Lachnospiraceae bacterium]